MSTTFHYANLTKAEWFSASAFGGSGNVHGLGHNLTPRAFQLLLVRGVGHWADDSIAIIGDVDDNWLAYHARFRDLYADLIPFLNLHDGFEALGEAAVKDDRLYVQICHLIVTRQAPEPIRVGMRERFGANFLRRYKDALPTLQRFEQPMDIATPAAAR